MKPSKGKYSKRNSFTSEHEFVFAEHLLHMHRSGEISSQNIGSHVIPEVTNMLLQRFGIPFPSNSIRSKYYALQSITRLYISFKKRGTGMGWDSTNYTFMMDDERWSQLVQVNEAYARFYNCSCLLYHMLEEVFMNRGATGDFSAGYGDSPPNSADEQQMKRAARRCSEKGVVDVDSSEENVPSQPVSRKGKQKVKNSKGKRRSGDMSCDSFFSPSSPQFQQYVRVLDSIDTHLSCKKSKSGSAEVSSLSKSQKAIVDDDAELEAAMVPLCALGLDINVHLKMADLLRSKAERIIWFSCTTDDARLAFVRHRGLLPPA
ncbi:uncharacterized protein [Coffea arabica]|uniref:Myb/SANT-like domain-containing protein n=1 Tax=Coffea arabica TaxID=13443 RepID=A0ABM4VXK0_COFAR